MLGEPHLRVLDPLGLLDELSLVRLDRLELLQQRLVEDLDGDLARVAWVEAPPQLAERGGRRLLLLLDLHRPLELGRLDAPIVVLVPRLEEDEEALYVAPQDALVRLGQLLYLSAREALRGQPLALHNAGLEALAQRHCMSDGREHGWLSPATTLSWLRCSCTPS